MRLAARALSAALGLAVAGVAGARADDSGQRPVPSIVVEGEASRDVVPDVAIITLGVMTDRPKAQDAARENGVTAKALVAQVIASGVAAADVVTTRATLSPLYDNPKDGGAPRLRGFRAANSIAITVRKLKSAGDLAGRLIDLGANELQGIEALVSTPEPILDQLRAEAARTARLRAEIYASALGVKLGPVLAVRPEPAVQPMGRVMKMAAPMAAEATSVPLEAGTQKLEAHVSVTFAIDQPQP